MLSTSKVEAWFVVWMVCVWGGGHSLVSNDLANSVIKIQHNSLQEHFQEELQVLST